MAYWDTIVQTFFLPRDKLITWLSALKGIIAAYWCANFFVMKITVCFRLTCEFLQNTQLYYGSLA